MGLQLQPGSAEEADTGIVIAVASVTPSIASTRRRCCCSRTNLPTAAATAADAAAAEDPAAPSPVSATDDPERVAACAAARGTLGRGAERDGGGRTMPLLPPSDPSLYDRVVAADADAEADAAAHASAG